MDNQLASECRKTILEKLDKAGREGLTMTGLHLPGAGSNKGQACREVLKQLLKDKEIGNLGSPRRPRYVAITHFKPLEMAYEHIEAVARESGMRLTSKSLLSKGLRGEVLKRVDEALKLLVAEGALVRLKWAGKPVYVHASALPSNTGTSTGVPSGKNRGADLAAIKRAYRETVNEFGYPDVLIHEVFLRLGGELEPFKEALMEACRTGRAVPSVGDWSLSSPEERGAALYINGHPHLRIRFKE